MIEAGISGIVMQPSDTKVWWKKAVYSHSPKALLQPPRGIREDKETSLLTGECYVNSHFVWISQSRLISAIKENVLLNKMYFL